MNDKTAKADPVRAQFETWLETHRGRFSLWEAWQAALAQQAGADAVSLAESLCAYMRDEDKRLPADVFKLPAPMQTALVTLRGLADAPMRIHPRDATEAVDYIVAHALAPQPAIPEVDWLTSRGNDPRVEVDSYAVAIEAALIYIGAERPDDDEPEEQWFWDKLTALLEIAQHNREGE